MIAQETGERNWQKDFRNNHFDPDVNWQVQLGYASQSAYVFSDTGQPASALVGVRANNLNAFIELQGSGAGLTNAQLGIGAGLNEGQLTQSTAAGQLPTQDSSSILGQEKKRWEHFPGGADHVCKSIFYITDREPTGRSEPCHFYSGRFDTTDLTALSDDELEAAYDHVLEQFALELLIGADKNSEWSDGKLVIAANHGPIHLLQTAFYAVRLEVQRRDVVVCC